MKGLILIVSVFVSSLTYSQNLDFGTKLDGIGASETVYYMMTKPEIVNIETWSNLFSDSLNIRLRNALSFTFDVEQENVTIKEFFNFLNSDRFQHMRDHETTMDVYAFVTHPDSDVDRINVLTLYKDLDSDLTYDINIDINSNGDILSIYVFTGAEEYAQSWTFCEGAKIYRATK